VIHGNRDFVPVGIAEEIASAIDGATLVVLTRCGHFAYLDQPEEVHRRVVEFVSRR
jgi:pimeloyl-ACP methyl ester carboxylesterase